MGQRRPWGIVTAGAFDDPTGDQRSFLVERFEDSGTLDTTFSGDGFVLTAVGSGRFSRAFALTLQSNGRIVVAGHARDCEGASDFALCKISRTVVTQRKAGLPGRLFYGPSTPQSVPSPMGCRPTRRSFVILRRRRSCVNQNEALRIVADELFAKVQPRTKDRSDPSRSLKSGRGEGICRFPAVPLDFQVK
jgi:hypothetical protein